MAEDHDTVPCQSIKFSTLGMYKHKNTNIHFKLKETVSVGRISRER